MTVFERILDGSLPGHIVHKGPLASVLVDIRPTARGHLLVISNEPFPDIHDVPDTVLADMAILARDMATRLRERLGADGVNLIMNNGEAANQVVFHAHIHIIPRYLGDGLEPWHGKDTTPEDLAEVLEIMRAP